MTHRTRAAPRAAIRSVRPVCRVTEDDARTTNPTPGPVEGILDAIGATPLVRLSRFLDRPDIDLYAKLECLNPGGSMKDRPANEMLRRAIATGEIGPDTLIVESSSGNMGIGLAQACRYHGLRFRCVIDGRTEEHNVKILRAYGAEIDLVTEPDAATGDLLAARLARVREILASEPDAYWPNQYANEHNPLAHQLGTMREIDEALSGTADYVFVATSSTGTARGCDEYLRAHHRSTAIVAVDAWGSVLFGGPPQPRHIPGLGAGVVPPLADRGRFSDVLHVSALDCVVGCRRLVEREGILAGGSAGGVVNAVRRRAPDLAPGTTCVAILGDSGTRYLDSLYSDEWVHSRLGVAPADLRAAVSAPDACRSSAAAAS